MASPAPALKIWDHSFYARDPSLVARDLLGTWLLHQGVGGLIVETEAYRGACDPASHAFRGPTDRNRAMFGEPGFAYVYFIYGNHFCLNVVAHPPGEVGAVLLRALEPRAGVSQMRERRNARGDRLLASGPGRLCQALGIGRQHYGLPFDGSQGLWLGGPPEPAGEVRRGPRIGVRQAAEVPLRFYLAGNPHVSR